MTLKSGFILLLETLTALVLLLVLATTAWMALAAYWPDTFALGPTSLEVIAVIVLLTIALLLVSIVALVHTRRSDRPPPPARPTTHS